ncbi:MAG: alpha-amylase family glycosyl hydrolase [Betaproteobacteria bacterium]
MDSNVPAPANPPSSIAPLKLHVPSPDWRDQIIYFLMIDRFNDGDVHNNNLGAGEFDASSNTKYNGGDLTGIRQQLDYIAGLGATAVWVTPPVANLWWDGAAQAAGYHGYWAENFMEVDRHLGTLEDYRQLSHAIHGKGMYLVQDIVVNHTANFFSYGRGWTPRDPAQDFSLNAGPRPITAPSQWPFSMNDARNAQQRRAGVYHWTPDISNYTNPIQEMNFQMAGLDDLNTENPAVRQALRKSYGYWISEVGVDAFRVDTAFYVPPTFFSDFLNAKDAQQPGIAAVARQTGRDNFLVFGEGFSIDKPYSDKEARKVERYVTAPGGRPLLSGMLNFSLYGAMGDVFARGHPSAELGYRITSLMKVHKRPHLMPTFIDNHDVDRFLAGGSEAGLRQSLLAMMTLPGIPTILYGTEQAFTESRAAMFKAGFQSGGRDRFDTQAPLYRFIADISALRRNHRVFSRGIPAVLSANSAMPGALAWRMTHEQDSAVIVLNTADDETLMDNVQTNLPAGTVLRGLFGLSGTPPHIIVGAHGKISMKLAARSGQVWQVTSDKVAPPVAPAQLTMSALPPSAQHADFTVSGTAGNIANFQLVVDGAITSSERITPGEDGRWSAIVRTGDMIRPDVQHRVVAWAGQDQAMASATQAFRVARDWTVLADIADPAGDDIGARGSYRYPTDPGWGRNRQLDIRRAKISGAGGAIKIEFTMNKITTTWRPPNGFDHVAFSVFLEIPGRAGGGKAMPFQNAMLPAGMRWHYRLRANGWTNSLFTADGASESAEGKLSSPAAEIFVDHKKNTVSFVLPARALGNLSSLSGVKIYATTWDYDGGYRTLSETAQPMAFGGRKTEADPLVMDDTPVITLP